MKKTTDFANAENNSETLFQIDAGRTDKFYEAARELSDFVKELPLSKQDNDKLVELIIQQLQTGERDAFLYGMRLKTDFQEWRKQNALKS